MEKTETSGKAKISFCIPYPKGNGKKLWTHKYGMNAYYAGKHWAERKKDSEFWHMITRAEMRRQGIPKKVISGPVTIQFFWNDGLDIDNHAVMGKMIVDAMKGWVIEDDSRRYLKGVAHSWWAEDKILIVINEV